MSWKELLANLSDAIFDQVHENSFYFDPSEVKNNWLGFEPASEIDIVNKEDQLGVSLPKSYLDFLAVSNGFRQISHFAGNLLPIHKIDRLRVVDEDLYDVYSEEEREDINNPKYFDYSDKQSSVFFRIDHLLSSIAISSMVEGSIVLLNPHVTFENNECEAWIYASWYPGAYRFKSFKDLMEHEYRSTLGLK